MLAILLSVCRTLWDVVWFWRGKTVSYFSNRPPLQVWSQTLREAGDYAQWAEAAQNLDVIMGLDMWRHNPTSKDYDYRLINERLRLIQKAREAGDVYALINTLRTGLVRNLGNITSTKLFNCCFSGTKRLIEEYVQEYVEAIQEIAVLPAPAKDGSGGGGGGGGEVPGAEMEAPPEWEDGEISGGGASGTEDVAAEKSARAAAAAAAALRCKGGMATATIPTQYKLDFIHDTRQGFGRSALVLQGGAIFGLCHLGVVKALLLQGLLPRIIVGTATGAMMAALVAVHPEEDLLRILTGDGIDLSAFATNGKDPDGHNKQVMQSMWTRWGTVLRRVRRFRKEGYFLDVKILEECVRTNIGDLTFEEAFNRSKRVLNITVVTAGQEGVPTLLNYVTAPNVLVWTAAVASNASSTTFYGHRQTRILCKDAHGNIAPWAPADTVDFRHWTSASYTDRNAPLQRVSGLFNVNHYVVSQARPYLIPFLQSDMHGPLPAARTAGCKGSRLTSVGAFVTRMVGLETRHRLRQLDRLRLLPPSIRRFLVDEHLPGPSVTLVPQISLRDFVRLVETPTKETLEYWIVRGERSVWPAVAALRVRCAIEMELDRAYQDVRRLKAGFLRRKASEIEQLLQQQQQSGGRPDTGVGVEGWMGVGEEALGLTMTTERRRAWSISSRCPPSAKTVL
ncbi:acyl transferase/acyl hydrolase/lysophospholipase [Parachaetomium inaequale]|uniref:Acyl transferase/acyl hydrolase/lysophospholipase n=1 Tax=Parachaetomium inaequale TaxID=2588326 RepID=A0AAN6SU07_9PEZI|nr:acyl transferase/acyl hydrolase/lysophospholipase [Parachaetomium inaequale]